MNSYGYNPPKDSLIKIDIKTSINTNTQKKKDSFSNYKKYTPQQVTDSNPYKSLPKKSKTVKVTNWSIKIK